MTSASKGEGVYIDPVEGHGHTHTVIILHGRGSNGEEFADEFLECEVSEDLARILAILAHPDDGPEQPNNPLDDTPARPPPPRTLRALFPTFKWSTENPNVYPELQEPGLCKSIDYINECINEEADYVSFDNIFLGGISQGFAAVVATHLHRCGSFAGLFGYASWAYPGLAPFEVPAGLSGGNGNWKIKCRDADYQMAHTPIFLAHALNDEVVPVKNGRALYRALRNIGMTEVEWHEYQYGGNWFTEPEGIDHLVSFLMRNMGSEEDDYEEDDSTEDDSTEVEEESGKGNGAV
ncbi:Alpha/Beta hydrolase protein [Colletotrichum phormii]|uniref:Alpha/Beta hydrolase protein n=1 Tax=Colletotrichum phormii TaxID=359342 RepID=A0AAI9ZP74_9PEZI|nr:Alpha/Beta hydrolase protein [Colletotrichum phormii]KAK1635615.1 Alpha/Beta hydrolase protein [Colletotrichum phormii]